VRSDCARFQTQTRRRELRSSASGAIYLCWRCIVRLGRWIGDVASDRCGTRIDKRAVARYHAFAEARRCPRSPRSAQSKVHQNLRKYSQRFGKLHSNPRIPQCITWKYDRDRAALIVACRFSSNSSQRGTKMITATHLKPSKTPVLRPAPNGDFCHVTECCHSASIEQRLREKLDSRETVW
jgi:hypothetical protein